MPERQGQALMRVFGFYDALDQALADGDAEEVAWLVASRAEAVEELVDAAREAPLPEAVKRELAEHERRLHLGIVRLHDAIYQSLTAQRRVAHAVSRYTTH